MHPLSVFWRVFAVHAGLWGVLAALLLFSPVEISAPIRPTQALIVVAGPVVMLAANAMLLRRALAPLQRLAQRMETVDLLRPGQRLQVLRNDEISRVVVAFNTKRARCSAASCPQAGSSPGGRYGG